MIKKAKKEVKIMHSHINQLMKTKWLLFHVHHFMENKMNQKVKNILGLHFAKESS